MRPSSSHDRDVDVARASRTRPRPALPLVRPFLQSAPKRAALARRHPSRPSASSGPRRGPYAALRYAAAAAIGVGGYIHFCLYRNGFRTIPKIGVGFLLQVLTSGLVAAALLVGRERIVRLGRVMVRSSVVLWVLGLGVSLGTLAAFGLSHTSMGLFNFREFGWEPAPQALVALVAELTAVVLSVTGLRVARRRPLPAPARVRRRLGPVGD